jgi:hypothetical protein
MTAFRVFPLIFGPVLLASISLNMPTWLKFILFALGVLSVGLGVWFSERTISRMEAERVLNTAVDFIHAMGAKHIRANFAARKRRDQLRMKYKSDFYWKFEKTNAWESDDGSCASAAFETGCTVLGGHIDELVEQAAKDAPSWVHVRRMKYISGEATKCVLCLPVSRNGSRIGVVTFDDQETLKDSKLASREVLDAARQLANRGFHRS